MRFSGTFFEKLFERFLQFLSDAAEHWSKHTNRRTILTLIVGGTVLTWSYVALVQPPDDFPLGPLVTVPEGASLSEAARVLSESHAIRSEIAFKSFVKLSGHEGDIHAGDYLFKEPRDVFSVARALITGAYGLEPTRIRVREGATTKEMAALFAANLQRFDSAHFLASAQPQEGYFFPDTYFFLPNATDKLVEETMRQNFDEKIASIQPRIASSTHSLAEIVTMASILEREAYNTQDRRMIAGVLWNRLAKGMALQVDVTFAYTIGKGTFQLTMKDLTSDSPYNTYKYKGLPPTAIGSPSLDSILAAVTPIKSDNLYFLADHHGVTHYCKTYACQLANKAKYF